MTIGNGLADAIVQDAQESNDKFIADKIMHVLSIYPIVSPTMLQAALGPGLGPKLWRPILERLIANGYLCRDELQAVTPAQRNYSYTRIMLRSTYFEGVADANTAKLVPQAALPADPLNTHVSSTT